MMSEKSLHLSRVPNARAQMLIRKPVNDVFNAIVDPAITSKFWFSRGSGKLEKGKRVQWNWATYGVSAQVDVKELEPNRRILFEWPSAEGSSAVEWLFTPY
jgi:uncharacterized protein YndB with AHSA1/START domain